MSQQTVFAIDQHALANGLRLVLCEDHVAPVVAVNLWYDVGSRHERPGRTGLAHLFEHLMFEGSRQVPAGGHFQLVAGAGGTLNATTSADRTNYFETVPAEHLDLALWLEADRMGGLLDALTQESLDNQRDVVKNERRQRYDNVPYGRVYETLCERLFPVGHPYHHQPIGSMEDLEAASLEDVQAFFRAHYAPNNAVLTVVGHIDPAAVVERVEHYFGAIPANPTIAPAPDSTLAAPLAAELQETVLDDVPDEAAWLAYRLPPEGDPVLDHLEVGFAVLGHGRGSTLKRKLVDAELAQGVNTSVARSLTGASVGLLQAIARSSMPIDQAEPVLRAEIARLADEGPTEAEVERAKAMLARQWLDRVGDLDGRADELSRFATQYGDPTRINDRTGVIMAVTADDIRTAFARHLVEAHPVVVKYVPAGEREAAA